MHNIIHGCGPTKHNNEMLGVQFESMSMCATFDHPTIILRGPTKQKLHVE